MSLEKLLLIWYSSLEDCKLRPVDHSCRKDTDGYTGCRRHRSVQNCGSLYFGVGPSFKMSATAPVKQPFCSQLEERLILWLEYHSQVRSYARGFANTYRLPIPKHALFAIGYTFESNPHDYLPDIVGILTSGKPLYQAKRTGMWLGERANEEGEEI